MLPPKRLKNSKRADERRRKVCPTCKEPFERDTSKYSNAQWEAKVFCSNACAQSIPLAERLFAFSTPPKSPTGCWEWTGTRDKDGYGRLVITKNGRRTYHFAHRLAWQEWMPEPLCALSDGQCVMHTCDNPPCINPDHLRLGTNAENVADRDAKGRGANQYGSWGSKDASS